MAVSTINDERQTIIMVSDRVHIGMAAFAAFAGMAPSGSISFDGRDGGPQVRQAIDDPEAWDEIARGAAHVAATLRGDLATWRGEQCIERLRETPGGDKLVEALERREGAA